MDFSNYFAVIWKPIKERALTEFNDNRIRSLVSANKIWFFSSDLDRLRGLHSNASNTAWRIKRNREYENKHWVVVNKNSFVGTQADGIVSQKSLLIDEQLAKQVLTNSTAKNSETAYKTFVNGILQKSHIKQNMIKGA